eukprot:941096-Rhodomonas_salina.1
MVAQLGTLDTAQRIQVCIEIPADSGTRVPGNTGYPGYPRYWLMPNTTARLALEILCGSGAQVRALVSPRTHTVI